MERLKGGAEAAPIFTSQTLRGVTWLSGLPVLLTWLTGLSWAAEIPGMCSYRETELQGPSLPCLSHESSPPAEEGNSYLYCRAS